MSTKKYVRPKSTILWAYICGITKTFTLCYKHQKSLQHKLMVIGVYRQKSKGAKSSKWAYYGEGPYCGHIKNCLSTQSSHLVCKSIFQTALRVILAVCLFECVFACLKKSVTYSSQGVNQTVKYSGWQIVINIMLHQVY